MPPVQQSAEEGAQTSPGGQEGQDGKLPELLPLPLLRRANPVFQMKQSVQAATRKDEHTNCSKCGSPRCCCLLLAAPLLGRDKLGMRYYL